MAAVNRATLLGNLGQDPEIAYLASGKPVAKFSIATTDTWRDKITGERKERTEWHRIVIFSEGLVKVAEQYLKKGAKVYLEGQIQTRKWEKDGHMNYSTEIVLSPFTGVLVMCGSPGGSRAPDPTSQDDYGAQAEAPDGYPDDGREGATSTRGSGGARRPGDNDDLSDAIPFRAPFLECNQDGKPSL
jgi:single-strand DNA-binding protein